MLENKKSIQERMSSMKKIYQSLDSWFNLLDDQIPLGVTDKLRDIILGDENLQELMDGIDKVRPPRILLMGRTGSGKSSLINALCSAYVAKVSDVHSCTIGTQAYPCTDDDGRVLMEILDTRGIAESQVLDEDISAEEQLLNDIKNFNPDIVLFVLPPVRDNIKIDIEFIGKVKKEYYAQNGLELPVVVAINKVDQLSPSRMVDPNSYTDAKVRNIHEILERTRELFVEHKTIVDGIVPVSSLIDWADEYGNEISVDEISHRPKEEQLNLQICFDGRYRVEDLREIMEKSIKDHDAVMGLKMAFKFDQVVKRFAKQIINTFTCISSTIALSPIPLSDIYILIPLQTVMIGIIANLSGKEYSNEKAKENAKEFLVSMVGVGGAGFGLKILAQQMVKAIPGAGSVISASIAGLGTRGIGYAAYSHFIEGKTIEEAKKELKKTSEELDKERGIVSIN